MLVQETKGLSQYLSCLYEMRGNVICTEKVVRQGVWEERIKVSESC